MDPDLLDPDQGGQKLPIKNEKSEEIYFCSLDVIYGGIVTNILRRWVAKLVARLPAAL